MRITTLSQESEAFSHDQFATDVLLGLSAEQKSISAKYFYDDAGSELFQKITKHTDYYPTQTEFSILENSREALTKAIADEELDIIELGVGDGHKTRLITEGFISANRSVNFYPIDISAKALELLEKNVLIDEKLTVHGVVGEYFEGLKYISRQSTNRKLVLFLGSNIGNFDPAYCQRFLRLLWRNLNHNDTILIGFDLKKNIDILTRAYNDSDGLTEQFNLNLLTRMNNELGGNFDIESFAHFGSYNPVIGAMESYLLSMKEQSIHVEELGTTFHFKAFEPLHLEYSFKFLQNDIENLAHTTGFSILENFTDKNGYFIDSLWKVNKGNGHV